MNRSSQQDVAPVSQDDRLLMEDVCIPCQDAALRGELVIPFRARGIVIFAHGSGSSRHSPRNKFVSETMRKKEIATLLFDLLTVEEEREDIMTGYMRFDIELLSKRLLDATDWILNSQAAGGLGIGYFGSSTGGAAALAAARLLTDKIQAVVSRGGRPDLAEGALPWVSAPTLLVVGGKDREVLEVNEHAFQLLRCEKELDIVPDATHLFEEPGALERVADLAADWFFEHLVPRA